MENSIPGEGILNIRGTLSQGCPLSINWLIIGRDPLLIYLERRLQGILISTDTYDVSGARISADTYDVSGARISADTYDES